MRQSLVMTRVSLSSLPQRIWPSLIIVISMTCVVGVLLSMLSKTAGIVRAYETGGSAARAIVLPSEIPSEYGNSITRNDAITIMSAPGIAHTPDGGLAADAEILFWVPPAEGYKIASPDLRGVGAAGLALRPGFAIVSGRNYQPGRQELIVGVLAQRAFGLKVGDKVILPNGEWQIVGAFSADGGLLEAQLVADADTVMQTGGIGGFGSVLVQLEDASAFDAFKLWLSKNPALAVTAERQSDYDHRTASQLSDFFTQLAYAVGVIMTLGALFGSIKLMQAAVNARTRDIATLRAIGYLPSSAAIAVVIEMILLSLIGACCGAALAWLLFDGRVISNFGSAFDLAISSRLFLIGVFWALLLAIVSALPPALRAARLPVAHALRAV